MGKYNDNATYGVDLNNLESAIFEIRDNVAIVTLNRPEALNSLNTAIHRDVGACWEEINNNDEIKAAVVVGSGRWKKPYFTIPKCKCKPRTSFNG